MLKKKKLFLLYQYELIGQLILHWFLVYHGILQQIQIIKMRLQAEFFYPNNRIHCLLKAKWKLIIKDLGFAEAKYEETGCYAFLRSLPGANGVLDCLNCKICWQAHQSTVRK